MMAKISQRMRGSQNPRNLARVTKIQKIQKTEAEG
jgi:hypothetical protein